MAAGNFTLYNSTKLEFFNGTQDWDTDAHYCILLANTYTPDVVNHSTLSSVSGDEIADADYTRQDMSGEAATESGGTVTCDAADVSFGASVTITARFAVVVVGTVAGAAAGNALVGYVELDTAGDVSSSNGSFDIIWNASGLFTVT